jgi:hypothetical protein
MLQKILTESRKAASPISDPAERASTYNSIAMREWQQGDWRVLKFPAIEQENKTYQIQTLYRRKLFRRKKGEALHPGREPLEVLAQMREIQGEYNFSGQYQQAPSPLGGGIIKTHWLHFYQREELPQTFESVFQSWDTASQSSYCRIRIRYWLHIGIQTPTAIQIQCCPFISSAWKHPLAPHFITWRL